MVRILLTEGRFPVSLEMARQFHRAGHQVFVADTKYAHACRCSNSVTKSFKVPSPRFKYQEFISKISQIVEENKIDVIVPVFEEILYLAKGREQFPKSCTLFCDSFQRLQDLHSKWTFIEMTEEAGLPIPKTQHIQSQDDLNRIEMPGAYLLKPCFSRGAQGIVKIEPGKTPPRIEASPTNPWVAQEFIEGDHYCTYSVCQNGEVKAHSTYPVQYAIDSSSCLTFRSIHHPRILEWVKQFVKKHQLTGQISFDFIEGKKGLFSNECNPRTTSGFHLFDEKVIPAFFDENAELIVPKPDTKKQIGIGMLLYSWKKSTSGRVKKGEDASLHGYKDVIYSKDDLLPFLLQPLILSTYLIDSLKLRKALVASFTHDVDWKGEVSVK